MILFKRRLNRRGEEETGLGDFVHIVFVILLLLLLIYVGYKFIGALIGGGADNTPLDNFLALADNIELMIEKDSGFEYQTMISYLKKRNNYFIFGFNAARLVAMSSRRPKDCNGKPCLCLYKTFDKHFPLKPYKCREFDDSVIFHGFEPDNLPGIPLHRPQLYSDYPQELAFKYNHLQLSYDKIVDFYIEKFVADNGNIHILVIMRGELSEINDIIDQRISLLSECPDTSDEQCKEKRRNSKISSTDICYFDKEKQKCLLKTDINNCAFDLKITEDCMCGSVFVIKNDYSNDMYCFNKASGNILILPFNCKSNDFKEKECDAYCTALTDTRGCDSQEQIYCEQDPCEIGTTPETACKLERTYGRPKCWSIKPP